MNILLEVPLEVLSYLERIGFDVENRPGATPRLVAYVNKPWDVKSPRQVVSAPMPRSFDSVARKNNRRTETHSPEATDSEPEEVVVVKTAEEVFGVVVNEPEKKEREGPYVPPGRRSRVKCDRPAHEILQYNGRVRKNDLHELRVHSLKAKMDRCNENRIACEQKIEEIKKCQRNGWVTPGDLEEWENQRRDWKIKFEGFADELDVYLTMREKEKNNVFVTCSPTTSSKQPRGDTGDLSGNYENGVVQSTAQTGPPSGTSGPPAKTYMKKNDDELKELTQKLRNMETQMHYYQKRFHADRPNLYDGMHMLLREDKEFLNTHLQDDPEYAEKIYKAARFHLSMQPKEVTMPDKTWFDKVTKGIEIANSISGTVLRHQDAQKFAELGFANYELKEGASKWSWLSLAGASIYNVGKNFIPFGNSLPSVKIQMPTGKLAQ